MFTYSSLFILALAQLQQVSSHAYIGCFNNAVIRGGGDIYDSQQVSCPDLCPAKTTYAKSVGLFGGVGSYRVCRCDDSQPATSYLVEDEACAFNNIKVSIVNPPGAWHFERCFVFPPIGQAVVVSNTPQCFTRCVRFPYASVTYTRDNQITCRCATNRPPLNAPAACRKGNSFLYSHRVPSQAISKRDEQLVLEFNKEEQLCPDGMETCLVPYADGKSFETELESCGGCLFGEVVQADNAQNRNVSGTDCSALIGPSLGGITYEAGKCAATSCDEGYAVEGDECVPSE
ncbi:hypothetical protein IAU59_005617 [Kwoniella sp. CBS 9459]